MLANRKGSKCNRYSLQSFYIVTGSFSVLIILVVLLVFSVHFRSNSSNSLRMKKKQAKFTEGYWISVIHTVEVYWHTNEVAFLFLWLINIHPKLRAAEFDSRKNVDINYATEPKDRHWELVYVRNLHTILGAATLGHKTVGFGS